MRWEAFLIPHPFAPLRLPLAYVLLQVTFQGNTAIQDSGAVYASSCDDSSTLKLSNVSFVRNSASVRRACETSRRRSAP